MDYAYTDAGKITGALANQVFNSSSYSAVSTSLTQYAYARTWSNNNWNNSNIRSWAPMGQLAALATTWSGPGVGIVSGQPRPVTRCLSQSAYTYDDDSQRLTNTVSTQPIDPATGNPQVDGNQNPILTSRQESYGYDALNRLRSVDYGDGQTQGYSFDAMGNRAQKTDSAAGTTSYAYDAANRLTSTNGQAVTSDADGNTLTDASGRTNVWDSQNRLVSCTANGTTSTYTYGADGLRRTSTVNGVTTYYVYDGTMMVREMQKNAQGQLQATATYLQGPRAYRRAISLAYLPNGKQTHWTKAEAARDYSPVPLFRASVPYTRIGKLRPAYAHGEPVFRV